MPVRPPELVYAVDEWPPWSRLVPLGLQYAILISIYLIIVAIVARGAEANATFIQNAVGLGLVAAAIGTAAQAWKGRFFGSGFLAPPAFSALYLGPAILAAKVGGMPAVAGMTIFAALTELVLSRLLMGMRVVFQPSIAGFTVFVIGIELGIVGISDTLDVRDEGVKDFPWHVGAAVLTLAVCIGFSVWGSGLLKLLCTLIGIAIGVVAALAVGLITPEILDAVATAPWLALPDPRMVSYGFEPALIPAFLAAGFAAALRAVGVVTSCQKINDAAWKRPDFQNIQRGVVGDAIGCLTAGFCGVPGMSIAPSMVGVSSATGATSRVIAFVAAVFLLAFAFMPKIGAAVVALPLEIAGAVLVFTASLMIVSGLDIMMGRGIDLRTGFSLSVALLLGLLTKITPTYFEQLPEALRLVTSDMMTVSLIAAIALTLIFRIGIRRRDVTNWSETDAAVEDFVEGLKKERKAWRLDDEMIDRSRETVEALVAHLKEAHLIEEPVAIKSSSDGIDLLVEVLYRGRPVALPGLHGHRETDHEEASVTAGLRSFAAGANADRVSLGTYGDQVNVRLWFAL